MYQFYELGYVPSDRDKGTNSYFAMASGLGAPRNQFVASHKDQPKIMYANSVRIAYHSSIPSQSPHQTRLRA